MSEETAGERIRNYLEAYRGDGDRVIIDNPVTFKRLTVGDLRALLAENAELRQRAESATVQHDRWTALLAERDAWRERAEKAEATVARYRADDEWFRRSRDDWQQRSVKLAALLAEERRQRRAEQTARREEAEAERAADVMRVPMPERTAAIQAKWMAFGFSGPTEADRERDQVIGWLLDQLGAQHPADGAETGRGAPEPSPVPTNVDKVLREALEPVTGMRPENVPDALVRAAVDADRTGSMPPPDAPIWHHARVVVAAVLTHLGLSTEYGLRITYTSTRTEEGPVAETLGGALDVLARFDAQARPDVLRHVLTERWVGEPREIGEGRG